MDSGSKRADIWEQWLCIHLARPNPVSPNSISWAFPLTRAISQVPVKGLNGTVTNLLAHLLGAKQPWSFLQPLHVAQILTAVLQTPDPGVCLAIMMKGSGFCKKHIQLRLEATRTKASFCLASQAPAWAPESQYVLFTPTLLPSSVLNLLICSVTAAVLDTKATLLQTLYDQCSCFMRLNPCNTCIPLSHSYHTDVILVLVLACFGYICKVVLFLTLVLNKNINLTKNLYPLYHISWILSTACNTCLHYHILLSLILKNIYTSILIFIFKPAHWKDNLANHKTQGSNLFSFNIYNVFFHLSSCAHCSTWFLFLLMISSFCLEVFKILASSLIVLSFTLMILGLGFSLSLFNFCSLSVFGYNRVQSEKQNHYDMGVFVCVK